METIAEIDPTGVVNIIKAFVHPPCELGVAFEYDPSL